MENKGIARALNLLGENVDLFSANREGLLDLIEDYNDHMIASKLQSSLLSHPAIIIRSSYYEYSHQE